MERKQKGILAFCMVLCMLVLTLQTAYPQAEVYAAQEELLLGERFEVDGIGYRKLDENTVSLIDRASASGTIEIPKTVPGTDDTVVSIGEKAFYNNNYITEVVFPDTITDIGASAFEGANSIQSLTLPPNLKTIGERAFTSAMRKTGSETIDLVIPDTVTSVGKYAFWNCKNLASVKLPQNLTRIEYMTFRDCTALAGVEMPEHLIYIGKYAFSGCSALTGIELPEGLAEIGARAFEIGLYLPV